MRLLIISPHRGWGRVRPRDIIAQRVWKDRVGTIWGLFIALPDFRPSITLIDAWKWWLYTVLLTVLNGRTSGRSRHTDLLLTGWMFMIWTWRTAQLARCLWWDMDRIAPSLHLRIPYQFWDLALETFRGEHIDRQPPGRWVDAPRI